MLREVSKNLDYSFVEVPYLGLLPSLESTSLLGQQKQALRLQKPLSAHAV